VTTRTETNGLRRKRRRAAAAAVAGGLILIAWMSWLTVRHTTDVSAKDSALSGKTSAVASASAVGSVANQGKALASNVTDECQSAVFRRANPAICVQASVLATATPSVVPGPQGPSGATGPAANQSQVQSAVNTYLALHPPPIDYTVLRAFVNSYLAAHPAPSGPAGSPGPSGASGEPGTPGAPGSSGLSGLNGDPGKSGDPGVDAPRVVGITAGADGQSLVFTFDKGTPITMTVPISLPNGCPSTMMVTPPDPGVVGSPGNPSSPYPVCVPTG